MATASTRGRSAARESEPKPRNDAYTGLLLLALLAQIAGVTFLAFNYMQYYHKDASGNMTFDPPKVAPLASAPAVSPAPPGPGNPPPGVPPGNPPGVPPGNPPGVPPGNPPGVPPGNPPQPPKMP
jgi:hypothetical protein